MPVYNAERYVAEAVESVLAQTFADFEFLITDDGSTDGSLAILQRYAERDYRIRLTSRANTGIVVALNEMLAAARGEFIARMDADDVCLPERFEKQVASLAGHLSRVAVGAWADLIDPDGHLIGHWEMPADHSAIDGANVAGSLSIVHPTLMARRDSVWAVGGYQSDVQGSEDLDLVLKLAEHGTVANLAAPLLRYRRHSESYTHAKAGVVSAARAKVLTAAWRRRGLGTPPATLLKVGTPSRADHHATWAWLALGSGQITTARKHAYASLRRAPFSPASWKVVACAIRGR